MTDERTPSQKNDCIWGRAVGFAAGWSVPAHARRRQRSSMCPWEYWWHMRGWVGAHTLTYFKVYYNISTRLLKNILNQKQNIILWQTQCSDTVFLLTNTIFDFVCLLLQDRTPALPAKAGLRISPAVFCPVPRRAGDEVYTSTCNYKLCKPCEYTTKRDSWKPVLLHDITTIHMSQEGLWDLPQLNEAPDSPNLIFVKLPN